MNKNLFELSQEEKNRIRGLHESYINKPGTKLIWEQTDKIVLSKLNEKINSIILSQTNLYKSQLIVQLDLDESGEILLSFYRSTNPTDKKSFRIPTNDTDVFNALQFDTVKLSNFYPTIFADPDLKTLYDTNASVRQQMDNAVIKLVVTPDISVPFDVTIEKLNNDRERRKSRRYVKGDKTTFDNFYKNAGALFGVTRKLIFSVGAAGMSVKLQEIRINDTGDVPPSPTPPPPPVIPDYTFTLEDVFKFDSDELKDPTSLDVAIDDFKNFMKRVVEKRIQDEILNKDVKILGYASSDGNPEERDGGNLAACSQYGKGKGPRKDYDKCLSQKRAEVVANIINDTLKSIPIMYGNKASTLGQLYPKSTSNWAKAVGMGQNSDVSKIKWDTPGHTVEKTASDRRIVFTPTLTTKS